MAREGYGPDVAIGCGEQCPGSVDSAFEATVPCRHRSGLRRRGHLRVDPGIGAIGRLRGKGASFRRRKVVLRKPNAACFEELHSVDCFARFAWIERTILCPSSGK